MGAAFLFLEVFFRKVNAKLLMMYLYYSSRKRPFTSNVCQGTFLSE